MVVSLKRTDGAITLQVRDDGCGIQSAGRAAPSEGFGLRSMQERAETAGGHLTIRQPGAKGTVLEVVLS